MSLLKPKKNRTNSKRTRDTRRKTNDTIFWADKRAAAGDDPAKLAAVAWDQLRAAVKSLPPAQRTEAWRQVSAGLEDLRADLAGQLGDPS